MAMKFDLKAQTSGTQAHSVADTVGRMLSSSLLAGQRRHYADLDPQLLSPYPKQAARWTVNDDDLEEMTANIRQVGVLQPICVRQLTDGIYQILAGHQRTAAAIKAGLKTIPCLVFEQCNDNAAEIIFNATNLLTRNTDNVKPSALAAAYTDMEAALLAGGAGSLRSTARIAEITGASARKIQRYKKLTQLVPEIMDMVDNGNLSIVDGGTLSAYSQQAQAAVVECLQAHDADRLSKIQIGRLTKYLSDYPYRATTLNQETAERLLYPQRSIKTPAPTVKLKHNEIAKYFPSTASEKEIHAKIIEALDLYFKNEVCP